MGVNNNCVYICPIDIRRKHSWAYSILDKCTGDHDKRTSKYTQCSNRRGGGGG